MKNPNWNSFALPCVPFAFLLSIFGWQDHMDLRGTKTHPTQLARWGAMGVGVAKILKYFFE